MTERPTPEQIDDIRKSVAVAFDLSHEQPSDVLAEWVVSLLAEVDALRPDLAHCEKSYVTVRTMLAESEAREKAAIARAVAAERDASDTRDDLIEALEQMTSIAATLSLPGAVTGDRLVEEVRRLHAAATATGEHYSWINHGIRAEKERDEARAKLAAAEQRAETAELALRELHAKANEVAQTCAAFDELDDPEDRASGSEAMTALHHALSATPTDLAEALRRELRATAFDEAAKMAEGFDPERESMGALVWAIEARAAELRGPK